MPRRVRKFNRLRKYDYSQPGYYFITICTKNKKEWFGQAENGKVKLNSIGEIAKECLRDIPEHYMGIKLDFFSIMPNHIHCIIIIHDYEVGNRHARSLRRQYQAIPIIVGSYKSSVTKLINRFNPEILFFWQKSYHDHITRNEQSLQNIRQYIQNNPLKWNLDIENGQKKFDNKYINNYYKNLIK